MFVLTEIIDCIFLLFSKSPVRSCLFLRCTRLITDVAQDGVFLEIALRTLWTPQPHSDNVITLLALATICELIIFVMIKPFRLIR
jgi:hypothetical protein